MADVSDRFFVFVNESLPTVAQNIQFTRRITSGAAGGWTDPAFIEKYLNNEIDWLPFVQNPTGSPWLSFFSGGLVAAYAVELDAEVCRRQYFPDLPSRLSAVYAFGDYASCERAATLYGWPLGTVRELRLLDHPLTRLAKVNMEIVSLARYAYAVSMLDPSERQALWRSYWSGEHDVAMDLPAAPPGAREVRHSGVLWEYLIDGALELV